MIIFRYITRETLTGLLVATSVLLLIFICNQFARYLNEANGGLLTLGAIFQLMLLQVPLLLSFLLPLGLYLGVLFAYGRLNADSEIVVLSASGMTPGQFLRVTLWHAVLIGAVVAVLMLWMKPIIYWHQQRIFTQVAASMVERVVPGRFQSIDHGKWVVYAQSQSADHRHLNGVFVLNTRQPFKTAEGGKSPEIVTARRAGVHSDATQGDFFVFEDGHRYQGSAGHSDYQIAQYQAYGLRIPQAHGLGENARVKFASTQQLWQHRNQSALAVAELQWRLAIPLSVGILALLALGLSRLPLGRGRYARLLPAVLIYISYMDLLFLARAWMKQGKLSPELGLWWVHGLFFLLALGFLIGPGLLRRK